VVPFLDLFVRRYIKRTSPDELTGLRASFLSLVWPLFIFLLILPAVSSGNGSDNVAWFPLFLAAYGVFCLANILRFQRRPLMTTSPQALAVSYRAFMFIGAGFADSVAFMGFAGVFLAGKSWLYLLGLMFALVGLTLVAPTEADIERKQRQVEAQGSPLSLLEALIETPPPRWRRRQS
jgi:hypothetical protein